MTNTTKRIPLEHTAVSKVLPFLKTYKTRYGFMPSNKEIATHFKKSSAWWANLALQKLANLGAIKLHKGKRRGITIL